MVEYENREPYLDDHLGHRHTWDRAKGAWHDTVLDIPSILFTDDREGEE
jgi:hypothetical protein